MSARGRRSSSSRCCSIGLGMGALASQLGAVTVSAVPDEQSAEVGGVQNTMTNLGASLGTALAGSIMIAALRRRSSPTSPRTRRSRPRSGPGQVKLASGVPFVSDADLKAGAGRTNASSRPDRAPRWLHYADARIDGLRSALAILALLRDRRAIHGRADPRAASRGGRNPHPPSTTPWRARASRAGSDRARDAAVDADVLARDVAGAGPTRGRRSARPPPRPCRSGPSGCGRVSLVPRRQGVDEAGQHVVHADVVRRVACRRTAS